MRRRFDSAVRNAAAHHPPDIPAQQSSFVYFASRHLHQQFGVVDGVNHAVVTHTKTPLVAATGFESVITGFCFDWTGKEAYE